MMKKNHPGFELFVLVNIVLIHVLYYVQVVVLNSFNKNNILEPFLEFSIYRSVFYVCIFGAYIGPSIFYIVGFKVFT